MGDGWHLPDLTSDSGDQASWVSLLEMSFDRMRQKLEDAPAARLDARVEAMDQSTTIAGWRVLLLMAEHEVHHRSQLDTYAGLAGWEVPDLFGYSFEEVERMAPILQRSDEDEMQRNS